VRERGIGPKNNKMILICVNIIITCENGEGEDEIGPIPKMMVCALFIHFMANPPPAILPSEGGFHFLL